MTPTRKSALVLPLELMLMVFHHRGDLRTWPSQPGMTQDIFSWGLVCKYWRSCLSTVVVRVDCLAWLARCATEEVMVREVSRFLASDATPRGPISAERHAYRADVVINAISHLVLRQGRDRAIPLLLEVLRHWPLPEKNVVALWSPFILAAGKGSVRHMELILSLTKPIFDFVPWFFAAVECAIRLDKDEAVSFLLQQCQTRAPFALGLAEGDVSQAESDQTIARGVMPRYRYPENLNWLLRRAAEVDSPASARLLIRAGAQVQGSRFAAFQPMLTAVACNSPSVARVLVEHGLDVDRVYSTNAEPSDQHATALTRAVVNNARAVVEVLMGAGANPDLAWPPGSRKTARALALISAPLGICELLGISREEVAACHEDQVQAMELSNLEVDLNELTSYPSEA